LTTIVADIDSGADPVTEWQGVDLAPYLLDGRSFLGGASGADTQGVGGHGSVVAAEIAGAIEHAGQPAAVMPLVAIGSGGQADPDAVGAALQWLAAEARAWPSVRFVGCLPITGSPPNQSELAGIDACYLANVPISEAAGNSGLNLNRDLLTLTSLLTADELVCAAGTPGGGLVTGSNFGSKVAQVAVAVGSPADGTSGAAAIGAAWLATEASAFPGASGTQLVSAVAAEGQENPGTAGLTEHGWLPGVPHPGPLVQVQYSPLLFPHAGRRRAPVHPHRIGGAL
jgi:hypothetical protein